MVVIAMSQFGELVLLIGDAHIPQRAIEIPSKFKEMLIPNKVQHVLCTGNLGNKETLDWVKGLSTSIHIVAGDFDMDVTLPETKVVTIGEWRVGLVHGHQVMPWEDPEALSAFARQLDVDILVYGHTHKDAVLRVDGKYLVNPGSATGAYSALSDSPAPGFILMAFSGRQITIYVYHLVDDKVSVEKQEIVKS
jgi:vacuolar protein sorting-associated protein 29